MIYSFVLDDSLTTLKESYKRLLFRLFLFSKPCSKLHDILHKDVPFKFEVKLQSVQKSLSFTKCVFCVKVQKSLFLKKNG